jgi:putative peptide zinc metalloprotease protein
VAVNHTDGGSTYEVAYSLVTVSSGSPVTETNNAEAVADCQHCTTVAVSFQVVLVVGQTDVAAPVDTAQALNYDCPACSTTAVAEQMVVTLKSAPSQQLLAQLQADLAQLGALSQLGPGATPAAIQAQVSAVEQEITTQLQQSGIMVPEPPPSTATAVGSSTTPSTVAGASATTVTTAPASTSTAAPTTTTPTTAPAGGTGSTTTPTTAPPTTQSTSPPPTTVP